MDHSYFIIVVSFVIRQARFNNEFFITNALIHHEIFIIYYFHLYFVIL